MRTLTLAGGGMSPRELERGLEGGLLSQQSYSKQPPADWGAGTPCIGTGGPLSTGDRGGVT